MEAHGPIDRALERLREEGGKLSAGQLVHLIRTFLCGEDFRLNIC